MKKDLANMLSVDFSDFPRKFKPSTILMELCPAELTCCEESFVKHDLVRSLNRGIIALESIPRSADSDKLVFLFEDLLGSSVIAMGDFDLPLQAIKCEIWLALSYLYVYSQTEIELGTINSPLALAILLRQSRDFENLTSVLPTLEAATLSLATNPKDDPVSFFGLVCAMLSRTDESRSKWFELALEFNSADHERWSAATVHPLLPLMEGTAAKQGIEYLREETFLLSSRGQIPKELNRALVELFDYFL